MATPNPVRKWTLVVLAICVVFLLYSLIADRLTPYTSQAVAQAYIVGIAPEVAGRIIEVDVEDNQPVKAGQILFRIDPEPYQIAVEQAEAKLASVGLTVGASTAGVASAQAKVAEMTAKRDSTGDQTARRSSWSRAPYAKRQAVPPGRGGPGRACSRPRASLIAPARAWAPKVPTIRSCAKRWRRCSRPGSISPAPMFWRPPTGWSPICS